MALVPSDECLVVCGMGLFEWVELKCGCVVIQISKSFYHLADMMLSVILLIVPFVLLQGFAFRVAFWMTVLHDIHHVLTDWEDRFPWLARLSTKSFAIYWHTIIGDILIIGSAYTWLGFFATEDDGVGRLAALFYRIAVLAFLPVYLLTIPRIWEKAKIG
eukprot:TRINITY_DN110467_c0_g1_i1.p1 TRINITY_DN110467_c0_g1~~TRINITY_DN110467_c0_g1_i1.p1  ORF type:complete len:160 (-),score=17.98 TRINITY_DN110467_c0_g1_i1:62-541(-)